MLPKKHRLSKSAEVKQTTARGRSFFNPFFVLKIVPGAGETKVTVIASVKVSKKAVDRNRIKRIIRDEVHKHIAQLKPGNYAFIVKKSAITVTPAEIRENLTKTLTAAKILGKSKQ